MRRTILVTALVAMVCVLPIAAANATTGSQIIGYINAQRAANHIPAGITQNSSWSSACAAHNHYETLNGMLTHDEASGQPGYTSAGAAIAEKSVIYEGVSWTASLDPFESAPIHLAQVLAPRVNVVGASEDGSYGCVTTLMSRNRHAPKHNKIYTYPSDGATGWRTSEVAAEGPYTPGQRRGIPAGTKTGPYLLALFDAPSLNVFSQAKVTSASVTGPSGPVKIVTADNRTNGLVGYLPTGAYLIVRNPLAPNTKYTAKVSAKIVGTSLKFSHSWSFTTGS